MDRDELKSYLDYKYEEYNTPAFIDTDPIQLPHRFDKKEDIEIIGFLVSSIAWGKREMIIRSGEKLINLMNDEPYEFIMNYTSRDLDFVHRTFNASDLDFFFRSLRNLYKAGGLESAFAEDQTNGSYSMINSFRHKFLETEHLERSTKHISSPLKNSAAKRLNMFLRWMVRQDNSGVDFGIWKSVSPATLCIPLDVHTANISRQLGILRRKQKDWKAREELMSTLREFDAEDPAKYDFALFGIGAFEGQPNVL
jgi:uncharacterized protein (TIGR02757 family)